VLAKEPFTLRRSDSSEDTEHLRRSEGYTLPFPPKLSEGEPLDAELSAEPFDLTRRRPSEPSDVSGVHARRLPVIHNEFWVAGKVPSLNELIDAKGARAPVLRSIIMRQKPGKGNRRGRFDLYNDIKQDWKQRTVRAVGSPFVRVKAAFFGYLVVEESVRRDPSNICSAAIKFIEDGLVEAGVIPNDGWDEVLGIRVHWVHRKGQEPGVYVVMSDTPFTESDLLHAYESHLVGYVF
jgi:hypothetical protein